MPVASNVNHLTSETNANAAIIGLDGDGALCVFSFATVDLAVDVTGWFGGTDGTRLGAVTAARVLDTRDGTGGHSGRVQAAKIIEIDPPAAGRVGVGADVVLDVVATEPAGAGFLTLFPCGAKYPTSTSNLNFLAGTDAANLVIVRTGATGRVCLYSMTATHVVIDVLGSFGPVGALRSLTVSAGPLVPAFGPDGHDYGVMCSPGSNTWTIGATAAAGTQITVRGADGSGTLTVQENDAAVVAATEPDGQVEEYWIRCLPHDFPQLVIDRPDDPAPGWYLVGTTAGPAGTQYAVILDDHGAAVWYRKTPSGLTSFDVKRLPDGSVAWIDTAGPFGSDPTRVYAERSLDGTLVRTWATMGTPTDHHELLPLENGNMLMASDHQRSNVDVSALGPGFASPSDVLDAWIQEIRPDGTLAWEWHSEDHIGVAETQAHLDGLSVETNRGLDLVHFNSLAVDPANNNVVVSLRHTDVVFEIRRNPGGPDDGVVVWKFGGTDPTDPTTMHWTIVGDPRDGPTLQHDARILPNGHLTMYDNETGQAGQRSRAVEYALDVGPGTARLVWQYESPDKAPAFCCGSARRTADGSTVIGWGGSPTMFTDVGPSGVLTLEVAQEPSGFSYRVVKESAEAFDRAMLRATAGR